MKKIFQTLSNVETRQNSLTNSTSSMSTQEAQKSKTEGFTLQRLFHNRVELEHFRKFLADNFASLDLHCWMDIENYKKIPEYYDDMRRTKANDIVSIYLNRKYFFGPNSPAGLEGQAKVSNILWLKYSTVLSICMQANNCQPGCTLLNLFINIQ